MKIRNDNASINILLKLNESIEEDWFMNEGLGIAKSLCSKENTNCEKVSINVVNAALKDGIDCEVVAPYVINGNNQSNGHISILFKDRIIDYTVPQFLGDNKTVDYFTLAKNKNNVFVLNKETMKPEVVNEIVNTSSNEEILNLPEEILDKYIIEII